MEVFGLCPKLCWRVAGVSFYGTYSTWPWKVGHLDQVIILVWPNLSYKQFCFAWSSVAPTAQPSICNQFLFNIKSISFVDGDLQIML